MNQFTAKNSWKTNSQRALWGLSLLAAIACAPQLSAQSAVDISVGFGSEHDSAAKTGIDSTTAFACVLGSTSTCQSLPALGGLFMKIGGDIMVREHFGGGFQWTFQPARQDYGLFRTRESFFDVNGIYAPINKPKYQVQILGGIGGARTAFAYTSTCPAGAIACSSQTQPVGNTNHFAIHVGVGVQYFVWNNVFIKPEFDYHYVPGLTDQFGSNSVVGGTVSVGYGSRR